MFKTLRKDIHNNRDHGFTLIELLVVLIILGILGSIVTVNIVGTRNLAIKKSCRATAENIAAAVEQYYSDNGTYPPTSTGDSWLTTSGGTSSVSTYLKTSPLMVGSSTTTGSAYFQYTANTTDPTTVPATAYTIQGYSKATPTVSGLIPAKFTISWSGTTPTYSPLLTAAAASLPVDYLPGCTI